MVLDVSSIPSDGLGWGVLDELADFTRISHVALAPSPSLPLLPSPPLLFHTEWRICLLVAVSSGLPGSFFLWKYIRCYALV